MAAVARRRYFPAVEGMRGVAALSVLAGHVLFLTHPDRGAIGTFGQRLAPLGVVVFFVISGFLIYRPFVAARGRGSSVGAIAPNYLARRAVRILPAYWVAITVLAIWPGVPGVFSDHWWVCYSLIGRYSPDGWGGIGLGTSWTLSVEVSFYLALPLVALLLQNRGVRSGHRRAWSWELAVLGTLGVLSLGWRSLTFTEPGTEYLGLILPGTFSWFCIGMLLAALQEDLSAGLGRLRAALGDPRLWWALAALLFLALLLTPIHEAGERSSIGVLVETLEVALIAGCLMAPAIFGDGRLVVRRALGNRWIVYLGTVSYGIYLWHLPIVERLATTSLVTSSSYRVVTLGALAFAATVALGSASWFLVERPLMLRMKSVKALGGGQPRGAPEPTPPIAAEPAP